jgi:hypothetical protein
MTPLYVGIHEYRQVTKRAIIFVYDGNRVVV